MAVSSKSINGEGKTSAYRKWGEIAIGWASRGRKKSFPMQNLVACRIRGGKWGGGETSSHLCSVVDVLTTHSIVWKKHDPIDCSCSRGLARCEIGLFPVRGAGSPREKVREGITHWLGSQLTDHLGEGVVLSVAPAITKPKGGECGKLKVLVSENFGAGKRTKVLLRNGLAAAAKNGDPARASAGVPNVLEWGRTCVQGGGRRRR